MKSARSSVKAQPPGLPYAAISNGNRRGASLLTRFAHQVGATVAKLNPLRHQQHWPISQQDTAQTHQNEGSAAASPSPSASQTPSLRPGDVLRDVPFFIQASEVAYLSTNPSLCSDVFGFAPGEVLEMMRGSGGAVLGHVAIVVGARGGKLWVLVCGESSARALHVPQPRDQETEVRAATMAYHDACLLHHPRRRLTAAEEAAARRFRGAPPDDKDDDGSQRAEMYRAQQQELAARVRRVRDDFTKLHTRASAEAQRVYTVEQRAFLQCAPDLYIAAFPGTADVSREAGVEAPTHSPHMASTNTTSAASVYAAVARGDVEVRAVVLLPPRVLVATGTVGWTGEGDVALLRSPAAGLTASEGSLSASVAI